MHRYKIEEEKKESRLLKNVTTTLAYVDRGPLSGYLILLGTGPNLLPFCLQQGTMLCHSVMHARIAAHNGRARSYGMSAPDSCLLRCVRCKCATRACVMRCVRARKHYRRRCLGRGGKARRRRGMIHAPCLRDQGGRPAGRPAGGWGRPRLGPGWGGGVRGRGPRAAAVARGAGLYSMAGECRLPRAQETTATSQIPVRPRGAGYIHCS